MSEIKKGFHRVTEIISAVAPDPELQKQKMERPEIVENAARRGKLLHHLAGKIFSNQEISRGDDILISAFKKDREKILKWIGDLHAFHRLRGKRLLKKSLRMYNASEKVTGELDFIFEGDELNDLKTGKIPTTIRAQLGGYDWLGKLKSKILSCIHAPLDKRPKLYTFTAEECAAAWHKVLRDFKKKK